MTEAAEYPEILVDLTDKLTEALVARGLERVQAYEISREAAEFLRHEWGGQLIYLPKGTAYQLAARDIEIWTKWNGRNAHDLCREYDITLQRLYQILAAMREQEIAKLQGKLL